MPQSLLDFEIPHLPNQSPISSPIIPTRRMADADANALLHFFGEIDILCHDYGVTEEQEKKDATLRYVDYDTAKIWRMLLTYKPAPAPEQGQAAKAWREEVAKLYPGASKDTRYSYNDLN
ncbi:hypothetical protein H0H93_004835 [Arthromyces matolae]|nr:hypothetical protein H0H93_004835 [Arthromyces matolae]